MNLILRTWKRLVAILTTPIEIRWLFRWWRKKPPKSAEEILTLPKDEPEGGIFEAQLFVPFVSTKKYLPGPRFVLERRRKARAGKVPGVGPTP